MAKETPLPNSVWYVDGSARKSPITSSNEVGYTVVSDHEIIESACPPGHLSAQAAELYALTRACILTEGKTLPFFLTAGMLLELYMILTHFGN